MAYGVHIYIFKPFKNTTRFMKIREKYYKINCMCYINRKIVSTSYHMIVHTSLNFDTFSYHLCEVASS